MKNPSSAAKESAGALLEQALVHHEAGDYAAAIIAYEKLLAAYPEDVNGLTNFGLLHLHHRHPEKTIPLIRKSLTHYAKQPQALVDLATALRQTGELIEAMIAVDRALQLQPNFAEALEERAMTLLALKRYDDAIETCKKLLLAKPNYAYAYNMMGFAQHSSGQFEKAVASYDRVLALAPDSAEILSDKGASLLGLKRFDEALACFDRAVALNAQIADIHNNRGNAFKELGRIEESLACYDQALALNPDYGEAHNNRSLALNHLERYEEGLASVDRALVLIPNFADAHSNRGILLRGLKRYDEALASFDAAIALKPEVGSHYWNKSMLLILLGRYEEGWKLYEWRWKTELLDKFYNPLPFPLWLGATPIADKTIFIQYEQGLGDFIQFCRYGLVLESMGAKVVMETNPALLPLAKTLSPTIRFITRMEDMVHVDAYCPIMSLPHALRTTVETVPNHVPYLAVDPEKRAVWQQKLGPKTKPRIGLVWSGSPSHTNDRLRSMKLAQLAPLLQLPYEFHVLQKIFASDRLRCGSSVSYATIVRI